MASFLHTDDLGSLALANKHLLETYLPVQTALRLEGFEGEHMEAKRWVQYESDDLVEALHRRSGLTQLVALFPSTARGVVRALGEGTSPLLTDLTLYLDMDEVILRHLAQSLRRREEEALGVGLRGLTLCSGAVGGQLEWVFRSNACDGLRHLEVDGSNLSPLGLAALGRFLYRTRAPDLQALRLRTPSSRSSPAYLLEPLFQRGVAPRLQALATLEVNFNGELLARAIEEGHWPDLTELSLSAAGLDARGVGLLMSALAKRNGQPRLKILTLQDHPLFAEGVMAIARALRLGACPALETLDLLHSKVEEQGMVGLAGALGKGACPRLQKLHLHCNGLNDAGVVHLALALDARGMPDLRDLDLTCVSMGPIGMAALAKGLRGCPQLRKLNVSQNQVLNEGVAGLVEALGEGVGAQLVELDLAGVGVGHEGVRLLAQAFQEGACPYLAVLPLGINPDIQTEGVRHLIEALRGGALPSLTHLQLCITRMGVEGALLWAQLLEEGGCPTLSHLEVSLAGPFDAPGEPNEEAIGRIRAARPGLYIHS